MGKPLRWGAAGTMFTVQTTRRMVHGRPAGKLLTLLVTGLMVSACSSAAPTPEQKVGRLNAEASVSPPGSRIASSSIPKGGGVYKVGTPYQIDGQWYRPHEDTRYDEAGMASWYGADFHGRKTSNGEVYDMMGLSAAHRTLPMPSYVYVTNLTNDRTILLRVNDRGPYAHGRILDLSKSAAHALGVITHGTAQVRVRYAGPAPLDGNDWKERRFLASQPWSAGTQVANEQGQRGPTLSPAPPMSPQSWSPDVYRAAQSGLGR